MVFAICGLLYMVACFFLWCLFFVVAADFVMFVVIACLCVLYLVLFCCCDECLPFCCGYCSFIVYAFGLLFVLDILFRWV